jgi:hypothetical protein
LDLKNEKHGLPILKKVLDYTALEWPTIADANPYDPQFREYFESCGRRQPNRKEPHVFPIESFDC